MFTSLIILLNTVVWSLLIIIIVIFFRVPTTEEFQSFLNEKNDLFDENKENKKW